MAKQTKTKRQPWYACGLSFECQQCGGCCSGPEEGFIWVCDEEIEMLAKSLKMSEQDFRKKFTKKVGRKTSIIEDKITKDCIFLTDFGGVRGCGVYNCRPNQCRTWPFWDYNLDSPDSWNYAGVKCPGINRGKFYSFEEIEAIRTQQKWWKDEGKQSDS